MAKRRAKKKGRKLTPKQKKTLGIIAAIGAAWWIFSRRAPEGAAATVGIELQPAEIKGGEQVSAQSYRVIESMRPGMTPAPASGNVGGVITFTAPKSGMFTRNVVIDEGGQILAEVR